MKNKNKILITIVAMLVLLTGCTKILKNDKKEIIKDPITKQNLVENILCRPERKETLEKYMEHNIDVNSLPKCSKLKFIDGYDGLWGSFFIRPIAYIIVKLSSYFNSYGFAIILITIILRVAMIGITNKTNEQSNNMKNAKNDLDRLEEKYKNKNQDEIMMMKTQEMMQIYKKHNIKMSSAILLPIIQIPLFFAFLEAMNRIPAIHESTFLKIFELGKSPMQGILAGKLYYIIIVLLVVLTTYYSFKQTQPTQPTEGMQMKNMMNFMLVIIFISSITLPVGIALYWITNSGFPAIQIFIQTKILSKKKLKPKIIK